MRQTLTIVSVSPEPRQGGNGKNYWDAIDSEDVKWTVSEERIAIGLRAHKGEAIEFEVNVGEKNGRAFRFLNGAPGIPELAQEKRGGGGGYRGGGGGGSYVPRSAASFAFEQETKFPSFAWAYAKDLVVAGKIAVEQMPAEAEKCVRWMRSELSKIVATAPVLDGVSSAAPSAAAPKPAVTGQPVATQTLTQSNGHGNVAGVKLARAVELAGSEQRLANTATRILHRTVRPGDLPALTETELDQIIGKVAS